MAFKIERFNTRLDETDLAAQNFSTGEQAFRAAMGNVTNFITGHWDAEGGVGNRNGPMNNLKFKIYINRRPGKAEINLRYDYTTTISPEFHEMNNIFWRIIEV